MCIRQDAQAKRESIGLELYGFQQQLAALQHTLEKAFEDTNAISRERTTRETDLDKMKMKLKDDSEIIKKQRGKV